MKDFWEQRYSEKGWAYGTEPNQFLSTQTARLKPGMKALVAGDGEGRNGVWLAQLGLDVLSVDYSAAGLRKARELAIAKGTRVNTECVDLTQWRWPVAAFDVVVAVYLHFSPDVRATMHRAMLQALKPGGVLILEAFNKNQLQYKSGGPAAGAMLYSSDELRADFSGAKIEFLEDTVAQLNEGKYHVGPGAVLRLVLTNLGGR
ncbi:MAG: class I SAM-dependent methyltransferase [Gammaproteobacteria bacterium]|nr:class I SAM-dependent methyltransferase [Gammaproteobacteria bacterium]